MRQADHEREEAQAELRKLLEPGTKVYTVLRHVSKSGMYRAIDVYLIDKEPRRITWTVGKALGEKYDKRHEALGVGGCGMDMGFHVVYSLSRSLWPDGHKCTGVLCPSSGYALQQVWL